MARGLAAGILVAVLLSSTGALALAPAPRPAARSAATAVVDYVNISATSSFAFTPNSVTVTPGALVRLAVTQESDFLHTFLLSPQADYTIPTSSTHAQLLAYFTAHPPIVNLSLGSTPGAVFYANFTAPSVGTYEFVCIVSGHFEAGMHGTLVSGTTSSPGGMSVTTIDLAAIVIVVLAAVALLLRRRSPPKSPASPTMAAPPPTPPPPPPEPSTGPPPGR